MMWLRGVNHFTDYILNFELRCSVGCCVRYAPTTHADVQHFSKLSVVYWLLCIGYCALVIMLYILFGLVS